MITSVTFQKKTLWLRHWSNNTNWVTVFTACTPLKQDCEEATKKYHRQTELPDPLVEAEVLRYQFSPPCCQTASWQRYLPGKREAPVDVAAVCLSLLM